MGLRAPYQLAHATRADAGRSRLPKVAKNLLALDERRNGHHVALAGRTEHPTERAELVLEDRHFRRTPVDRPGAESRDQGLAVAPAQIMQQLRDGHVVGASGRRVPEAVEDLVR